MLTPPHISSECYFWDEFNPPSDFDLRPPPTPDDVIHGLRAVRIDLLSPTVLIAKDSYARPRKALRAKTARHPAKGRARTQDHRIVEQGLAPAGNREASASDRLGGEKGHRTVKRGRPPAKASKNPRRMGRGRSAAARG